MLGNRYFIHQVAIAIAFALGVSFAWAEAPKTAVQANNKMGSHLFKKVVKSEPKGNNVLVSPLSVLSAMSLAQAGATGPTQQQIIESLGFPKSTEGAQVNQWLKDLVTDLLSRDSEETIRLANSIWGNSDNFDFTEAYKKTVADYYTAEGDDPQVFDLPFSADTSLTKINQWVDDNTEGMIKEILKQLDPDMVAILINALFFEGRWLAHFDEKATYDTAAVDKGDKFRVSHFTTETGEHVDVKMMASDRMPVSYLRQEDYEMVSLAFCAKSEEHGPKGRKNTVCLKRGDFALDLILPAEGKTVRDVANSLDTAKYTEAVRSLKDEVIQLHVPKFKFAYGKPKSLKPMLAQMGIHQAFTPKANFKPMGLERNDDPVFIGDVLHKTAVEMKEGGFKAAAVTAVVMVLTSTVRPQLPKVRVDFDRAFLFNLRDTKTGSILFQGLVSNPQW